MRNGKLLNSFVPTDEREWDARLFIDEAIKNKTEYVLETLARALSGKEKIKFTYAEKDKPFENVVTIKGDDEKWITQTKNFCIMATMREFIFYGNTDIDIWLQIIDFWAGKVTVFPCGGASFPNEKFTFINESIKKY